MDAPYLRVFVSKPHTPRDEEIYAQIGGVKVGQAGELIIVSSTDSVSNKPDDFCIFAPGQWTRVAASREES